MSGFQAELFTLGAELEAGFTVESAVNENGAHSGEYNYTLEVGTDGWTSVYPNFKRTIAVTGAFYGTTMD